MISRDLYLQEIGPFIDKPLVKIISGIRRCGKSAFLQMLRDHLIDREISQDHIILINFESFTVADLTDASLLYKHIAGLIVGPKRYYVLLDEIQEVNGWEKAVNSLMVDFNADVYITGSNSRLLSSELATFLAGRYVEIHLYTLSFSEHLHFRQQLWPGTIPDRYQSFNEYLRLGGFPLFHTAEYPTETAWKIVYDIYSSVLLRDTIQRHNIRDVELLERVIRFVFDNIGNRFSGKNVADYFKSQQRKIDINTVYNYLKALESAFIVYRTPRYDVKGKEVLKTQEKYYVGDPSLIYAVMGYRDRMIGGILENIVMLELRRRGYQVYTGKWGELEIDFVAEHTGSRIYIQVSYLVNDPSTLDRELNPLRGVKDHYPKYLLTMDKNFRDNIDGILVMPIADFLVER
jgi:hypothetical protein